MAEIGVPGVGVGAGDDSVGVSVGGYGVSIPRDGEEEEELVEEEVPEE